MGAVLQAPEVVGRLSPVARLVEDLAVQHQDLVGADHQCVGMAE